MENRKFADENSEIINLKMTRSKNKNCLRISFEKIRSVAITEYVKWICNPRMILFFVLIIFVYDYIILEMKNVAIELSVKCMILEPFLAIGNSALLMLLIPALWVTLLGDFPGTDGNTMFYICRIGKKNWMLGQMLFAVMAQTTFVIALLIFSVIFASSFSNWSAGWSDVTTKYTYYFPEKAGSLVANLLPNRLYNNMSPFKAFWYTISLMMLYMLLISTIMMTGFAFGKRIAGITVNCVLMCVGTAFSLTNSSLKWYFPTANVIVWLHFEHYMKNQIFNIECSYIYYIVAIMVLIAADMNVIHRYDFAKITDMED